MDQWLELARLAKPSGIADYTALAIMSSTTAALLSRGILWDQKDPLEYLYFERPQLKHGSAQTHAQETRNIAQKLAETEKDIVVFWGSQSGTAEGFAQRLAREIASRFGQETMTADLSDYDPASVALIPETKLAIFILSTYGEGDPSDNTGEFWDWIRTKDSSSTLANLRYAAFGLGNSNYKFYNRVVDVVVERLDALKANPIMPVSRANDAQGTTQEDFMAWKTDLFSVFRSQLGFHESEPRYLPILSAEEDPSLEPIDLHHGEPDGRHTGKTCSSVRALDVANTVQLFHNSDRHCLHMDLDLTSQPELTYKTGDHLAVWPPNPDGEVDLLLSVLGLKDRAHVPVGIKSLDPATKVTIPTPTSIDALFRYYLEVCAPVNRDTVLGLAQFAPTPDAKTQLLRLGQDKDAYAQLCKSKYITIGRLLRFVAQDHDHDHDHAWSRIPLSFLVESIPPLQPRYYSISSSSAIAPRKPSITVLVASEPVTDSEDFVHGVTSNYLLNMAKPDSHPYGLTYPLNGPNNVLAPPPPPPQSSHKLFAHLRRTRFKLPVQSAHPLVLISAGTGLAPFRAFIAERRQLLAVGKPVGDVVLFFGCRNPNEDFIYREELETLERGLEGRLKIITAFSRFEDAGEPRRYVQDRVREHGQDVVSLLDQGANLYICGRAAMARDVEGVVSEEMKKVKGWGDTETNEWTKAIKKKNKWQEDVW